MDKLINAMKILADEHFPKMKQSRNQYKSNEKPLVTKAMLKSIRMQIYCLKIFKIKEGYRPSRTKMLLQQINPY